MNCSVKFLILFSHFWANSLLAIQLSDHIVFSFHGSNRQARQLAQQYEWIYISEVFLGSRLHHAVLGARLKWLTSVGRLRLQKAWTSSEQLVTDSRITWLDHQVYHRRELRSIQPSDVEPKFNDPLYPQQWYLHGYNVRDQHHLNVSAGWSQGLSGRGISLTILDNIIKGDNPEIAANYDPSISGVVTDASDKSIENRSLHGTYCAAVIAGVANNSICGVGVAFGSRIGGVSLLSRTRVLDVFEAKALNHQLERVDIYSASWGPPDDGKHLGGPGKYASQALHRGVHLGRKGRGAIYVWASGNGGNLGDHCGYDGYSASIYTLTVGALTRQGLTPFYSEPCPAALTSLYVGGQEHIGSRRRSHLNVVKFQFLLLVAGQSENLLCSASNLASAEGEHFFSSEVVYISPGVVAFPKVVPEMDGKCGSEFQGTSAAAPLAAGIIALLLEANTNLTWRDVHHLVVLSSVPPNDLPGWRSNGAELRSHAGYGFGALNTGLLIALGRTWRNVPAQIRYQNHCPLNYPTKPLTTRQSKEVIFRVKDDGPSYMEYAVVTISIDIVPRGALRVILRSPSGMASTLLEPRERDDSSDGFRQWNLTTAQFWGENSVGRWRLHITNTGGNLAVLHSCLISLYGF